MQIGIIGAGNIGGTLTRRLRALGHDVWVANSRGPETLAELALETGAKAVTVEDAAKAQDLIIVAIPERSVLQLPKGVLRGVPGSTVVIDTGNYYPQERDGRIVEIEDGTPESRWVERQIGHAVIKVFNNITARSLLELGKPMGTPGRVALPVAGDDSRAKHIVTRLVGDLGFDMVDTGGLNDSWRQQPGTPVYGTDLDAGGVRLALESARRERRREFRAAVVAQ